MREGRDSENPGNPWGILFFSARLYTGDPNFSESHKSLQNLGFRLQDFGSRVGGEPTFLKGSWDLVTRVINTVSILIITYSPT